MLGDNRCRLFKPLHDVVVMFLSIETLRDSAGNTANHRALQAMLLERGKIVHRQQFDRLQADGLGGLAEFFERNFVVAPFADGVVDVVLEAGRVGCIIGSLHALFNVRGNGHGRGSGGEPAKGGTSSDRVHIFSSNAVESYDFDG